MLKNRSNFNDMNRPLFVSIAILLVTTVGLALGTFMLHDAEQRGGQAGFVRITPVLNTASGETPAIQYAESPAVIECDKNKCSLTCNVVQNDSCGGMTPSKYLKDTMLVSAIMLSQSPQESPDLTWMQMEYFSASNGREMIVAQHEMIGIYLIEKKSDSEMFFMNFFDKGVEVKFAGDMHNGMPDIRVTNFDMSVGFYHWNGTGYQLDHTESWAVPA